MNELKYLWNITNMNELVLYKKINEKRKYLIPEKCDNLLDLTRGTIITETCIQHWCQKFKSDWTENNEIFLVGGWAGGYWINGKVPNSQITFGFCLFSVLNKILSTCKGRIGSKWFHLPSGETNWEANWSRKKQCILYLHVTVRNILGKFIHIHFQLEIR